MGCLTPQIAKEDIVKRLAYADPCARPLLAGAIDDLWRIAANEAPCGRTDIQYYATTLTALELLMLCDARQFDLQLSTSESGSTVDGSSRFDSNSQSQQSNSGYRQSDSCAHSRYDDHSRMLSERSSRQDTNSCGHSRSFARSADVGAGQNKSLSQGKRNSFNTSRNKSVSASKGSMSATATSGSCNKTFAKEYGEGSTQGNSASSGFGVVNLGTQSALSEVASRNYSASSNGHQASNASRGSSSESRDGKSLRSYCARGASHSKTLAEACSYFNNDASAESQSKSHAEGASDSQSRRHEFANAAGAGESRGVAEARQTASAQLTAAGHSDFEAKRESQNWSKSNGDGLWRSQRFKNLKEMHRMTRDSLMHLREHAKKSRNPVGSAPLYQLIRDGSADLLCWQASSAKLFCRVPCQKIFKECYDAVTAKHV